MPRYAAVFVVGLVLMVTLAPNARAVTLSTVAVGNPGNAGDMQPQGTFGAVSYVYRIGKYEVTNSQYAEFLNAKASSDPFALYSDFMGSDPRGGITRSGFYGSHTYTVRPNMGNKPVNFAGCFDAMRFANWLHNGQGSGDTETGAYTLLGGTPIPSNAFSITRNSGASWFLTSEDEWYKSAYYDPTLSGGIGGYWDYATRSNIAPTIAMADSVGDITNAGSNVANYSYGADWNSQNGNVTTVGSAGPSSESYYGTSDQGGNVWEWNETVFSGPYGSVYFGLRGGAWHSSSPAELAASYQYKGDPAFYGGNFFGFRVAGLLTPGDANTDGLVDGGDYTLWADHFLLSDQTWSTGDFNGDGIVDGADYTLWADNYAPPLSTAAAIPEPSAEVLAWWGGMGLLLTVLAQLKNSRAGCFDRWCFRGD